jgi:phosphatidylserine/phosphatidylglycerophosphate/cardiolipin synthase-like enzyme
MGLIVKDHEYLGTALVLIKNAKESINLSTFKLERTEKARGRNIEQIFQALLEKAKQGLKIRVLFNWHDDKKSIAKTNLSAGQWLKGQGIEVRHLRNNRCCHAKILSVDKERALIGSHNISVKSLESNFEISYLIDNKDNVINLDNIFMRSYSDAKTF